MDIASLNHHIPLKNFKKLVKGTGSTAFVMKNKQFTIFDADGHRVGFGTQYGSNSFSVSTSRNNGMDVQDYQVAQRLEHYHPGGTYRWNCAVGG